MISTCFQRDQPGEGRGHHRSATKADGMDEIRTQEAAQERPPKGSPGQRAARPNDGELEMDRPTLGDGLLDACLEPPATKAHLNDLCRK